jgi:hypothetical protein
VNAGSLVLESTQLLFAPWVRHPTTCTSEKFGIVVRSDRTAPAGCSRSLAPARIRRNYLRVRRCRTAGVAVVSCSGGVSTTTKSATSHVKGGVFRRSPDRSSTGTGSDEVRRAVVRRSQLTNTGKSAVFRVRASNRRKAPRRTTMPRGFFCAMHNVLSVDRTLGCNCCNFGTPHVTGCAIL